MLTRIISGAVGVLILGAVLFFHDTIVLPVAVALMIAIMLYELLRAVKMHKCIPVLIASEICGIAMPIIQSRFFCYPDTILTGTSVLKQNQTGTLFSFGITLICAFCIFVTWLKNHKKYKYEQIFFCLAVMVLVPGAMTTIIKIEQSSKENGLFMLVMALCGAWIADTGAYFSGVALGKHKLCPEISPKKTIEGFIGGILTTAIVYAVAFCLHMGFDAFTAVMMFVMGAVCAVIGTVGDLSASMVKRQIGFKDYGKIMPGHGGLMDRFDSVLFVLPTFYTFISITDIL